MKYKNANISKVFQQILKRKIVLGTWAQPRSKSLRGLFIARPFKLSIRGKSTEAGGGVCCFGKSQLRRPENH